MSRALSPAATSSYAYLKDALIGLALAVIVCLAVALLPRQYALDFLAAFLALTAASYFGSALAEGSPKVLLVETFVGLGVFAAALAGIWHSPAWLAVGYFGHGLWDLFHRPHRVGARVSMLWFPPVCLVFDWIVALFILAKLF